MMSVVGGSRLPGDRRPKGERYELQEGRRPAADGTKTIRRAPMNRRDTKMGPYDI